MSSQPTDIKAQQTRLYQQNERALAALAAWHEADQPTDGDFITRLGGEVASAIAQIHAMFSTGHGYHVPRFIRYAADHYKKIVDGTAEFDMDPSNWVNMTPEGQGTTPPLGSQSLGEDRWWERKAQEWQTASTTPTAKMSKPPAAMKNVPEPVRGRSRIVVRKGAELSAEGAQGQLEGKKSESPRRGRSQSRAQAKGKGKEVVREAGPSGGVESSAKGAEGRLPGKESESPHRGRSKSRAESKGKGKEMVRESEPLTTAIAGKQCGRCTKDQEICTWPPQGNVCTRCKRRKQRCVTSDTPTDPKRTPRTSTTSKSRPPRCSPSHSPAKSPSVISSSTCRPAQGSKRSASRPPVSTKSTRPAKRAKSTAGPNDHRSASPSSDCDAVPDSPKASPSGHRMVLKDRSYILLSPKPSKSSGHSFLQMDRATSGSESHPPAHEPLSPFQGTAMADLVQRLEGRVDHLEERMGDWMDQLQTQNQGLTRLVESMHQIMVAGNASVPSPMAQPIPIPPVPVPSPRRLSPAAPSPCLLSPATFTPPLHPPFDSDAFIAPEQPPPPPFDPPPLPQAPIPVDGPVAHPSTPPLPIPQVQVYMDLDPTPPAQISATVAESESSEETGPEQPMDEGN